MFFTNLCESNLKVKNFAKKVIYYTSTDSTNDDIWELYAENNEQDIIIITDYQKKGRGRSNNIWFSKPGHSITCSFLLKELFPREQFNLHSILIPVAIIKGVRNFLSSDYNLKVFQSRYNSQGVFKRIFNILEALIFQLFFGKCPLLANKFI